VSVVVSYNCCESDKLHSILEININEMNPDCSFLVNRKMDLVVKDVQEITW